MDELNPALAALLASRCRPEDKLAVLGLYLLGGKQTTKDIGDVTGLGLRAERFLARGVREGAVICEREPDGVLTYRCTGAMAAGALPRRTRAQMEAERKVLLADTARDEAQARAVELAQENTTLRGAVKALDAKNEALHAELATARVMAAPPVIPPSEPLPTQGEIKGMLDREQERLGRAVPRRGRKKTTAKKGPSDGE